MDSFHKIIEVLPSFVEEISDSIKQIINAYIQFEHFLNYYGSYDSEKYDPQFIYKQAHLINWLDGSTRTQLIEFLKIKSQEKILPINHQLESFEGYKKDIENLEEMVLEFFPIEKFGHRYYTSIIDSAVSTFFNEYHVDKYLLTPMEFLTELVLGLLMKEG